jgi:hypothetical protein
MPAGIGLGDTGHPGKGPGLDRKVPAGRRPRATVAGPRTGHSMVRTWNRWDSRRYWPGRHRSPRERPWPGPEGPDRQAIQDHVGRTRDRTFYGPHPEPPGCPPALAQAELPITIRDTAWRAQVPDRLDFQWAN